MGRPLKKDVLGVDALGTYATSNTGIRVSIFDSALRTDGVIIKQRGAKTFVCTRVGTIGTGSAYRPYVLVSGTPSSEGEMRIVGYLNGQNASPVQIRKITKRVATDWSGNRYKWTLLNDSSNDYIVLTAI